MLSYKVHVVGGLELKRPLPRESGLGKSGECLTDEGEFKQLQRTLTQLGR
jgi:hypothetical protein